ncbi:RNA-directed DNA polymerase, eukaryota, reverse transcriptase zinc-binding domain protein [Tanacetum coccineum]
MWYYFNEQWEKMVRKNKKGNGTKNQMKNDVLEDDNNIVQNMTAKDFKSSYNDVLKNDHLGVESIISNHKFFVSIIYALNNRRERKILWNDLKNQSNSINNKPWALMGDFNVTLRVDEHSAGGAFASADMQQFQAYMNDIEVMDLRRTVFHFTWTKSLNNPNSHILKKLDRIMGNDLFVELFKDAYACFCHTSFLVTVLRLHYRGVGGVTNDVEECNIIFEKQVNVEDALGMIKEVTNKEIHDATCDIDDNKAPEPDGYTSKFYKKAWPVIGDDVSRAIKEFFTKGRLLKEMNAT